MNRTAINGALLGSGGSDYRTFIASAVRAVATGVSSVVGHIGLVSSTVAQSTAASVLNGAYRFASHVAASAIGASDFFGAGIKQFSAAVTAKASVVMNTRAFLVFASSASATAKTASSFVGTVGAFFSSAVRATAAATSTVGRMGLFMSSVTARATVASFVSVGRLLRSAVSAAAYTRSLLLEASRAAPDRTMVLPDDARIMELPE